MSQRTVVIASRVGLHARPASLFTQAVAASGARVTIAKPGGPSMDASSILMVMALGVGNGEEVVLESEDEGVLHELVTLLETDLDAQ
ncbi:HPr family phosphocarrier protein [Georgenia muralis]|uniref:Phosphocarrier protein HPr n=1 Tax=Georgenia muralis TaxID=154117 RepID=A0A3N4Z892_9MICO|nr:HPr family phosphocarrier protein [Georgenia muralis]RPF27420.1 phosphocarrier protein HPr [Georgenia muralis]